MKIAVTGASGFIGREFLKIISPDIEVIALTRNKKDGFLITDYSVENLILLLKGVDTIVHLASIRGASDSYNTFIENEILIENILKAMTATDCKRIIYMSSISVYSDQESLPWVEKQCVSPQTFYGLSKITGEHLCRLYAEKGIQYIIFRCAIVYGLDHSKRMISNFIDRAFCKKTLILRGRSTAKRDFIYVKEIASVLCWAVEGKLTENETYNLGSNEAYTNYEIAVSINKCFENSDNFEYIDNIRESIINSYMNSDKLFGTGYVKQWNFADSLEDIKKDMHEQKII